MNQVDALAKAVECLVEVVQAGGAIGGMVFTILLGAWVVKQRQEKKNGRPEDQLAAALQQVAQTLKDEDEGSRQLVQDSQRLTECVTKLAEDMTELRREVAVFQARHEERLKSAI